LSAFAKVRVDLLARLSREWQPQQMRDLALTLLRLADALDQDRPGSKVRAKYRWATTLTRIERNAPALATTARLICHRRRRRQDHVPHDVLGEPAWDMLLDLFQQWAEGVKISVSNLCIAAGVPQTTALRYITMLEDLGLVIREPSTEDKRVTFVSLTELGILSVGNFLDQQY
jgi:predicted transcriptional regulator